jgi:spore coat protein U-like protein
MMKRWLWCCLMSGVAMADPMLISTQVVGTCVFAQPGDVLLDFGGLVAGQGDKKRSVDIKFSCTAGMPYKVALDQGQNASMGKRRMALASKKDYLPYELVSTPTSGTGEGEGKMLLQGLLMLKRRWVSMPMWWY